jgi:acyl-CoA-dependent ceramide synthase
MEQDPSMPALSWRGWRSWRPFARWWLGRLAEKEKRRGAETPKKVAANPIPTQLEKEGVRSRRKEQVKLEKITRKRKPGMTKEEWRRERSVLRFAEQGWAFLYYTVYWSLGLVSPLCQDVHPA